MIREWDNRFLRLVDWGSGRGMDWNHHVRMADPTGEEAGSLMIESPRRRYRLYLRPLRRRAR